MALIGGGQTSGSGGSLSWSLTGPAWLGDSAAFGNRYRAALQRLLPDLGRELKIDAGIAYAGTRFAATFAVASRFSPYAELSLTQGNPLFLYVEEPTRPHTIRPRNASVLRWMQGGRAHFAKEVHHPGTRGRRAIAPILSHYAGLFRAALIKAVESGLTT